MPIRLLLVALALCPLFLSGCGKSKTRLNPTTGQVFVNGVPAHQATVVFFPVTEEGEAQALAVAYPAAVVGPDGTFELTTFKKGDGAVAGDYIVAVVWCETTKVDGDVLESGDKLEGKYATRFCSPLRATINKGKNTLPKFELEFSETPR
jgi:hypothetical protein